MMVSYNTFSKTNVEKDSLTLPVVVITAAQSDSFYLQILCIFTTYLSLSFTYKWCGPPSVTEIAL